MILMEKKLETEGGFRASRVIYEFEDDGVMMNKKKIPYESIIGMERLKSSYMIATNQEGEDQNFLSMILPYRVFKSEVERKTFEALIAEKSGFRLKN